MKDKFRLRSEVVHLFHKDKSTCIKTIEQWATDGIPEEILERVERIRVVYGHEKELNSGAKCSSLSEHSIEGGTSKFHFTIEATGISNFEHNKLCRRSLMDEIQRAINKFMSENVED